MSCFRQSVCRDDWHVYIADVELDYESLLVFDQLVNVLDSGHIHGLSIDRLKVRLVFVFEPYQRDFFCVCHWAYTDLCAGVNHEVIVFCH